MHEHEQREILHKLDTLARAIHDLTRAINKGFSQMTTATDAAAAAIASLTTAVDAAVAAGIGGGTPDNPDQAADAAQLPEVTAAVQTQTARLTAATPPAPVV